MNAWAVRTETKARTIVHHIPKTRSGEKLDIFFKEYRFARPSWRFWLRRSKARCEFDNYGVLAAAGLPVAERMACGEKRDRLGRITCAWIITRAVPQSQTLLDHLASPVPQRERRQFLSELAVMVSRMHQARFFYYDLFGRNILASRDSGGCKPVLIDCPRGRHHRFFVRLHSNRDLASLDKDVRQFCRRTERLRFLLAYLGKRRLDDEAKKIARAVLRYSEKRWKDG